MAEFITQYITKHRTYTNPKIINVSNIVVHSLGVGQESSKIMRDKWDSATSNNSVAAVCDPDYCYIMLPCLEEKGKCYRQWGVGAGSKGSYNNSAIQIEMCEPKNIKYVGGATFTCSDPNYARDFFRRTMDTAIEFVAKCCIFHDLDPLGDNVIVTHSEACRLKMGSNHGDVEHMWNQLDMNYTLQDFRQEVANKVAELKLEEEIKNMTDEQFAEYMNRYLANLRNKPADTWAKGYLSWAKENGIMAGNDSGNLMPQSFLTRQEMATMLNAFYNKFI